MSKHYHNQYANKATKRQVKSAYLYLSLLFALFFLLTLYSAITTTISHTTPKAITTITTNPLPAIVALPVKYAKTPQQKEVEFQIRTIAHNANFQWPDYLVRLALYESSLNPSAINDKNRNGSIDYGLFQWNSKNPPISGYTKDCYMSIECSTKITMDAINKGLQNRWMANQITIKNK